MRKIKDASRLKLHARLLHERIAASLGLPKGVVTKYASFAAAAGLHCATVQLLSEAALERRLMGGQRGQRQPKAQLCVQNQPFARLAPAHVTCRETLAFLQGCDAEFNGPVVQRADCTSATTLGRNGKVNPRARSTSPRTTAAASS